MSMTITFRIEESHAEAFDKKLKSLGIKRGTYFRQSVTDFIDEKPVPNVIRQNQLSEYTAAATAFLIEHFAPEKQHEIIALTGQRLEQYHGQK
jgi:hypothetical protein